MDMERRKITWKDIALILLGIVVSVCGFVVKDLYAKVDTKVSRVEFESSIKAMREDFNSKSDLIITLIKQHSEDSAR